ncbi:MAG: hypothetical protein WC647_13980 [Desulfomonilaceae bacterium]|jgi:hypothetical protein
MAFEGKTSVPPDDLPPIVLRRLLLSKQFYSHGLTHYSASSDMDKMIAVHHFHISIEILLKAILLKNDATVKDKVSFPELINQVCEIKNDSNFGKHKQTLISLNEIRNKMQHASVTPGKSIMEEWRVYAKGALEDGFFQFFKLDFVTFSANQAIADPDIKEMLIKSCQYAKHGRGKTSLELSRIAFECASKSLLESFKKKHFVRSLSAPSGYFFEGNERYFEEIAETVNDLTRWTEEIHDFIFLLSSGLSLHEYKEFLDLTGTVSPTGGNFFTNGIPDNPDSDEVAWAHEYAVNTILNWQYMGFNVSVPEWYKKSLNGFLKQLDR